MEKTRILVWDLPVRVFHWLLVVSFAGAFATAESERVRDIHVALGYTFAALLAFRLVWGLVGTRYARFRSFAYSPSAVLTYLKSLLARCPDHHVGHNPAGSWMIYAIIALGVVISASGHAVYNDAYGKWSEDLHDAAANAMLVLVVFHVAGVVVSSFMHRENLVRAMLTGYKTGWTSEAIGRTSWVTAVALAAVVAMLWSGVVELPGMPFSPANAAATKENSRPHRSHHEAEGHRG
jgi:cytochrome b